MKQARKHAGLIAELLNTREGRQFVSETVPEILSLWSGDKKLRKLAAKPAARSIKKSFSPEIQGTGSLKELLEERDFLFRLRNELSGKKTSLAAAISDMLKALENLPPEELIKWGDLFFTGDRSNESILTGAAKIINRIHEANPRYMTHIVEKELKGIFERNDFGEIAEAADALLDDLSAASEPAGKVIWQNPAKALSLLSLIPGFINAVLKVILFQLRPLNDIAPDLLTNVIESLLKQVNGKTAGLILSEVSELIRKLDTGNTLLGDPGKPVLPPLLQDKLKDFISSLDQGILIAAMKSWDRAKAEIKRQARRHITEDPSLTQHYAVSPLKKSEDLIKNAEAHLSLLEVFFDRGNNINSSAMPDPVTAADMVNRGAELINDTPDETGKAVGEFFTQFFASLDGQEISEAAERVTASLAATLKPVAPEILPPIIRGIAELIKPDPDNPSDEMDEAFSLLKDALAAREATS